MCLHAHAGAACVCHIFSLLIVSVSVPDLKDCVCLTLTAFRLGLCASLSASVCMEM